MRMIQEDDAMLRRASLYAVAAVILGSAFAPSHGLAAKHYTLKPGNQAHPCFALVRPVMKRERHKARRIPARDIEKRILAITEDLGRNPRMHEALECLMRQDRR